MNVGRAVFKNRVLKQELTQGSIISGCISTDYPEKEVYGLIITPRCDLAHGIKVSSVHYIPLVKIDDWKEIDGFKLFVEKAKCNLKSTLNNWIKTNYGIEEFLDSSLFTHEKLLDMFTAKRADGKIRDTLELYVDFNDNSARTYLQSNPKVYNKILEQLATHNLAPFYIFESWNEDGDYFVANLREVHQISKNTALNLKTGFFSDDIANDFYLTNSLRKVNPLLQSPIIYEIVAQLNSPYIEHLLQRFTYNFSRIGVEDFHLKQFQSIHNYN